MSTSMAEKIESLLRKAESTEFDGEREALSAKAEKLMIKYGIEQDQLNLTEQKKGATTAKIVLRHLEFRGIYQMAHMHTAIRVAKAMGGSGWYTDYRRWSGVVQVTIVDFETTIEQTVRMAESIVAQSEYALKFWWQANRLFYRQKDGYIARRSYLEGFGRGAEGRITSERQEAVAETSGAGELVLVRRDAIDKVLEDNGITTKKNRQHYAPDAAGAGRRDGRNADTNLRERITR